MRGVVLVLVGLLLGAGCVACGGGQREVTTMQPDVGVPLTEPWKSMGFPLGGAVVVDSDETTLRIRFPLAGREELPTIHRALVQSVVESGWLLVHDFDDMPVAWGATLEKDGQRILLTTSAEDGRVRAFIRIRDIRD